MGSKGARGAPRLSLLTAYRRRAAHLKVLLAWLDRLRAAERFTDFELILAEGDARPSAARRMAEGRAWVRYLHVPMSDVFHKAVLLNRAAAVARGQYRVIFDVDLLPAAGVLARHLTLASESPRCLVAGYRVQLPGMLDARRLPAPAALFGGLDVHDESLLCLEDDPFSTREYLVDGQRFGVCPYFPAGVFDALGGLHEGYVGWGCEDQDLIERVCAGGLTLVRSYDLLYFHLPHGREPGWRDASLTAANRRRYAERRRARFTASAPRE
ncbi:MAG TPA: galactosyltransferase-related protein [Pyrinomonadaceae bacterium]|jgi:hypothetical protein